jgi:arylamine N-acetyltransferase
MVADRRGGYCFEHNLLLATALEHLASAVRPRARVAPPIGASLVSRLEPQTPPAHPLERLATAGNHSKSVTE